jgi:predicted RND superfamily exporter protein
VVDRLITRYVSLVVRKPFLFAGIGLIFLVVFAYFGVQLDIRSDFAELLPTSAPSVQHLDELRHRVASHQSLTVAIECPDLEASKRFAVALVQELEKLPRDRIRYIDWNMNQLTDFYKRYKWLFADLKDLEDFRDRLKKRIEEETEAAVIEQLDEEEAPKKTDLRIDELKAKYDKKVKEQDRYPDGFFVTPDRSLLAIFLRPPSTLNTYEDSKRLVAEVWEVVHKVDPKKFHPQMKVGFTGEVQTGIEERDALASDARFIGFLAVFLVLLSIMVFFASVRSVLVVGFPMLIGLATAFTVAHFAVGYLNSATAFLTSIIAGNGINTMIIMGARFYEEIRKVGPKGLAIALETAIKATMTSTLVADLTSALAYASLMFAGFRGFSQFGIIGGVGMVSCWLYSFIFGPAVIAALHTIRPLGLRKLGSPSKFAGSAARLVANRPKVFVFGAVVLSTVSVIALVKYVQDPFEYDFHKLRNRETQERGSSKLSGRVDHIFDLPSTPTPIIADSVEQARRIKERIMNDPQRIGIIQEVKTIHDYIPSDQEKKLEVLAEIRALIDKKIDFLSEEEQRQVLEYRPPEYLRIITFDDLPEPVKRPFVEIDGTVGRILYAYHENVHSILDGRFLLKYANYLRGVEVDGKPIVAVGNATIFADMITAIVEDGFLVTGIAFVSVLLSVILLFRSFKVAGIVLLPLICGILWMLGAAAIFDLKLNFLNFVVIPITLGIGVDYGCYLYARIRQEGIKNLERIIQSTGGAVFLTSLTTIIGYATLITSTNMALQSFGILADIGEIACLSSAELVMTATLVLLARRKQGKIENEPEATN